MIPVILRTLEQVQQITVGGNDSSRGRKLKIALQQSPYSAPPTRPQFPPPPPSPAGGEGSPYSDVPYSGVFLTINLALT
jgi:hypothetical protein